MPSFRITWFDGELVETRRAVGLRQLVEELLDEWIDDPELCPLDLNGWLTAQGFTSMSAGCREQEQRITTAAAVRRALMESDTVVRLFLTACSETLTCIERV